MNKLEEKKQNFDIDKNKQDIRRLEKSNRSQGEDIAALNQFKATTNTSLTKVQTDLSEVKSDIAALQAATQTEEKVELMSYDIIKVVDNTYRDDKWEPAPIYFRCDTGTKVKLRIKFIIKNTHIYCPTITTTIKLDENVIFSETYLLQSKTEDRNIDVENIFTSHNKGHKIEIKVENELDESLSTNYDKPDYFIIELFGTNVQFVSRNDDFMVVPCGNNRVTIATTCIDEKPRFLMKTIDENFTMEKSEFRTAKFGYYRFFNKIFPYDLYYLDEEGEICHSEKACMTWIDYDTMGFRKMGRYCLSVPDGETDNIPYLNAYVDVVIARPTMNNVTTNKRPFFVGILSNKEVQWANGSIYTLASPESDEVFADVCGVLRIDNYQDDEATAIVTRADGTSFFVLKKISSGEIKKFELGYGTNVNAYFNSQGNYEIYMRVGSSVKKIILTKNSNYDFQIISSEEIPNIQEYWLGPNGSHFERVGQQIKFFHPNTSAESCTFDVFY